MQSSHNASFDKIKRKNRKNNRHFNQGNPYRDKRKKKRNEQQI